MINVINSIYLQKFNEVQSRVPVKIGGRNTSGGFYKILSQKLKAAPTADEVKTAPATSGAAAKAVRTPQKSIAQNQLYNSMINEISAKYGVDPSLVTAVIKTESDFNPKAVSSAGAMGLMQLMPSTAAALSVKDAFDPYQNIDGGVRYLKQLLDRYNGDVKLALAAYNCGSGTLRRLNVDNLSDDGQMAKLPRETRNYVNKIMGLIGLD